ncbi:MAG TPA: T9SS type A sorting domain-containing protein [Chitinophagales bacterium]|nr:T9SS type A sorting domain-containing protein [Chitinophagales bacterium]
MKVRILIILLVFALKTRAESDTLTRAQVYDFSVGDTLDYRHIYYHWHNGLDTNYIDAPRTDFSRYIIQNIYFSQDSFIKYITRKKVYPGTAFDTLVLENLNDAEVFLDTSYFDLPSYAFDSIRIDSSTLYFDRTTNYITGIIHVVEYESFCFGRGLGKINDNFYGGTMGDGWNDSTTLIYYSGATGALGTPYNIYITSVSPPPVLAHYIRVFPNPGKDIFDIELAETPTQPVYFDIYDMTGKKVSGQLINSKLTSFQLSLSSGPYIWEAFSEKQVYGTGKIIVK